MKKLPRKITVMGRDIPIKYVSKKKVGAMIQNAEGIWDSYERCIYINKEAPRNIQLYYIYHEIGHAMKNFVGLDQVIQAEFQEVIVQSYATLIEDILKQSHKLK
jgi:Zn-dependent peptidase ImmA (M78 family)